jgi:hypothetical protein
MMQLNNFFFGESSSPKKIWEKKDDLGSTLKKAGIKSFEYLVMVLLDAFNFVTLHVDRAGKEGVDLIALAPKGVSLMNDYADSSGIPGNGTVVTEILDVPDESARFVTYNWSPLKATFDGLLKLSCVVSSGSWCADPS